MKRLFAISVLAVIGAWLSAAIASISQYPLTTPDDSGWGLTPLGWLIFGVLDVGFLCCMVSGIAIFVRGWRADSQPHTKAAKADKGEKVSSGSGVLLPRLLWCALLVEFAIVGCFAFLLLSKAADAQVNTLPSCSDIFTDGLPSAERSHTAKEDYDHTDPRTNTNTILGIQPLTQTLDMKAQYEAWVASGAWQSGEPEMIELRQFLYYLLSTGIQDTRPQVFYITNTHSGWWSFSGCTR